MRRSLPWSTIALLAGLAGAALLVILVIARGRTIPDGPQPVAWNHQPCAHCRMLVGEPAHAAQLITRDGDVAFFDDPGCLLHYLHERQPAIHRLWFHDSTSDRWLGADAVGFVGGATTPMGYGLAAVPRATPGAVELDVARDRLLGGAHAARPAGGGR